MFSKIKNAFNKKDVVISEVDYLEKGLSEDGAGNFDKAIEYFDTALALNPQSDGAWYSKGDLLSNIGKDENAIECYDKALEINPDHEWHGKVKVIHFLPLADMKKP